MQSSVDILVLRRTQGPFVVTGSPHTHFQETSQLRTTDSLQNDDDDDDDDDVEICYLSSAQTHVSAAHEAVALANAVALPM